MATDITPTGNDYYIVYEDSKKTSYVSSFLAGTNTSGKGGEREAYTSKNPLFINVFSTQRDYNEELVALGQAALVLTWDPYTEDPPDTKCNQNDDGDCT
jgi:hypothetical protein